MRWMAACVVLLICQAACAAEGFRLTADYGPYAVGFRLVEQYDPSCGYRDVVDAVTGEVVSGSPARPVQTLIWYPAAAAGRAMTYADYVDLWASQDRFDLDVAQRRRIAEVAERGYVGRGYRPADIARILAEPVHASSGAPPASGKFPLIIYAASDGSSAFENDSLCEYLASHGYVVLASPSNGAHVRYMTDGNIGDNVQNTRAQAADIGFLIGYGATLANADSTKVGVVAYSWGGMASTFAAATDHRIGALVDLDGSVRYFPKVLAAAPDITPDRIQAPLLYFADREDPIGPLHESKPGSFITRIRHADVTEIGLEKLTHDDLSSDSLRLPNTFDKANGTFAERNESYAWVARYTQEFLDAVLKNDAAAKAFMSATPAANHVPSGVLSINYKPATGPGASVASLAQALAASGFERSVETYDTYVKQHPGFAVNEDVFGDWFSSLSSLGRPQDAIDLCRLWVHVFPKSVDAWMSLGEAYQVIGDKAAATASYRHALQLDPRNVVAKAVIGFLATP